MHIKELTIYSKELEKQVAFYTSTLQLNCIDQSETQASIQIGDSILTIVARENATPYHFAINIPSNKEQQALDWLKQRVEILKDDDIEIHDFAFWNAKAMYFYDEDRNIVEFIARKNLNNTSDHPFDASQLLNISEIGLPTLNIEAKYQQLNALSSITRFSGDFDRFLAMGDDHGLFICVNKNIKDWFPTGDTAHSSDFELRFTNEQKDHHIRFEKDEIIHLG